MWVDVSFVARQQATKRGNSSGDKKANGDSLAGFFVQKANNTRQFDNENSGAIVTRPNATRTNDNSKATSSMHMSSNTRDDDDHERHHAATHTSSSGKRKLPSVIDLNTDDVPVDYTRRAAHIARTSSHTNDADTTASASRSTTAANSESRTSTRRPSHRSKSGI